MKSRVDDFAHVAAHGKDGKFFTTRLEAQRGGDAVAGPSVVYLTSPGGEARLALLVGSETVSRLEGESEAAFISRVEKAAPTNDQRGDI